MNMGIAIIILGLFIVLLVVVIYNLGRELKKKDAEIEELSIDLQEYVRQADKDARTITELQSYITDLSNKLKN